MEPDHKKKTQSEEPALPTPLARRYVRYVVGFGVAIGIGLAPFLGKVPGLDVMLDLFPLTMRGTLIPVSAFLMGIVAAAVQFYAGEAFDTALLRRRFRFTLMLLLTSIVLLLAFYTLFVEVVAVEGGTKTVPVIVGSTRLTEAQGCGCPDRYRTQQCIRSLSLNEAAIETCWDSGSIRLRRLLLSLGYLALTGGFGALIGLLLLQEDARRRERRRPRKTAA